MAEEEADVDPDRIGAIGWCMGGGYAAQLAVADPNLKAVAINYGALPTDKAALARIHAAVLGNFGGQDRHYPGRRARFPGSDGIHGDYWAAPPQPPAPFPPPQPVPVPKLVPPWPGPTADPRT